MISFEPISKRSTSKSFHEPSVKSVRIDVFDTYWRIIKHKLAEDFGDKINQYSHIFANIFHLFNFTFVFMLTQKRFLFQIFIFNNEELIQWIILQPSLDVVII